MLQEENSQHRLSWTNIYIQKKDNFHFSYGRRIYELGIDLFGPIQIYFFSYDADPLGIAKKRIQKKIFDFFSIIRV